MQQQLLFPRAVPSLAELDVERLWLSDAVLAPRTRKAYAHDWLQFCRWCDAVGRCPMPASTETVLLYLTNLLGARKISTGFRHTSSITHAHKAAGLASPCTALVWRLLDGAQRVRLEQPVQKAPVTLEHLRAICQQPAAGAVAVRDRAIILFGFASALRRSNIVALNLADIEFTAAGVVVHVGQEKQDQHGKGRLIGIPIGHGETCPVAALRAWLEARRSWAGPLFCSIQRGRPSPLRIPPNRVNLIVKAAVGGLGLDARLYGAHSLRAGFVTEAIQAGVLEFVIAAQTGHRSLASLRRYFRASDPFRANACSALLL